MIVGTLLMITTIGSPPIPQFAVQDKPLSYKMNTRGGQGVFDYNSYDIIPASKKMDETEYLMSSKKNRRILMSALKAKKITNKITIKTMQDSKKDKNLLKYSSLEKMFDDCWM